MDELCIPKKKLLIVSMLIELIGFLVGNYDDLIYF